jgi:hypothetical protein
VGTTAGWARLCLALALLVTSLGTGAASPRRAEAANAITVGSLNLTATFNSIGIELLFSDDDDGDATAALEFKRSADGTWRNGLPLWRTSYSGTQSAFYGSALQLDAGTAYDIRVTVTDPDGSPGSPSTGSVTTRVDSIASAGSLSPTRYVRTNGSDSNDGTSSGSAWLTLEKAVSTAASGAVVHVGSGYYLRPTTTRTSPLTLVAEYPAVDDSGSIVNAGQHSVIESGVVSGPTGATGVTAVTPWQQVNLSGPGNGGATASVTYSVWKWDSAMSGSAANAAWLGYASTRAGQPKRVAHWALKGSDLATPEGWIEKVRTNQSYNYGWAAFDDGSGNTDLYVRMHGDLNPNDYYMTVGRGDSALAIGGDDVRLSGFEIRPTTYGVSFSEAADRGVVDHNLIVIGYAGVRFLGNKDGSPHLYGADHVVQYNRIVDSSLWTEDHSGDPAVPWNFIKGSIKDADGDFYANDRIGENNETNATFDRGGAKRVVIRHNVVDGPFNGFGGYNEGYDRYAVQDRDIHDNTVRRIADDALEPEGALINQRYWENRFEDSAVLLSTGPLSYGPLYLFRNEAWRIRKDGVGRINSGEPGVGATFFKYSGSSVPRARVFVLHNTFWTDSTWGTDGSGHGVDGSGQYAGGGGNPESFYVRNNIIRATRYAFQGSVWDEDANHFSTSDTGRGLSAEGQNWGTNVTGYRSAYAGNHGNTPRTNVGWDGTAVTPTGNFTTTTVDSWLTNAASGNLTLTSGAPVVDGGVVVANVSDGYTGYAPDLGATERVSGDSTAPTISSVASGNVTYTTATITWSTNEIADRQVEYGTTTSYGSSSAVGTPMGTLHSVQLTGLALNTLYHFRVKSRDIANNLQTSSDYTFTTADCPCSLWSTSTTPANVDSGDNNAAEIGVKFTPKVSGYVTGVRFYKGSNNTGTHVGNLWSTGGSNLATVTFSGESGSGWQTATFSSPVAVTADTTYIVSYHTTVGRYSYNGNYFASTYLNYPLEAPSGSNGVYKYTSTSDFPDQTYNSTNYWVDAIFALSP